METPQEYIINQIQTRNDMLCKNSNIEAFTKLLAVIIMNFKNNEK